VVAEAADLLGTAYHESGHAVVAWVLRRSLHRVTIIPEGDVSGQCMREGWANEPDVLADAPSPFRRLHSSHS
jgi:Peptidase family M41